MIRFAARKKHILLLVGWFGLRFVLRSFGFKGEFCQFLFHGSEFCCGDAGTWGC